MTSLLPYHDVYPATGLSQAKADIVLLHGWGMNSLVWDELVPALNREYRLTLIDLPGMGRSPLPSQRLTLDFLTEQVLAVAPDKAVWVGWSLGSLIVQNIILQTPERITGSFHLAGSPCFVAREQWPFAMPASVFDKFQALLEEDWQGTLIRFLTLQCKGSETIRQDTQSLRERVFHHGLPAQRALRESLQVLRDNDLREALANTHTDIAMHFILGEFDALIPAMVVDGLQALNSNIHCQVISGASHVPQLSHASKAAERILSVLDKELEIS